MNSPRFLYRALKYRWRNDRQELSLIRQALPRGGVAVDIGAHKGGYLYWLQRWAGPHGEVWAFEPQPELVRYLETCTRRWPHVSVIPRAVSSQNGAAGLVLPPGARGPSPGAKLTATPFAGQPVRIITLDMFFRNRRPPDVIKCDCEGHELSVFEGATGILTSHHPALLFECEARHLCGADPGRVFRFLQTLGYAGWRLDPGGPVPCEAAGPPAGKAGNNYWFTPETATAPWRA